MPDPSVVEPPILLRGTGPGLGAYSLAFPFEERTMLHVLRKRATDRPDATWLVFDGRDRLTFGEAEAAANRVGHAIAAETQPKSNVGLFLPNQAEFVAAMYGAMAAGCVAVPFNAELRGPLLHQLLVASKARILVARADFLDRLSALDSMADVRLLVICGDSGGDPPSAIGGATVRRWEDWVTEQPDTPPRELPHASEDALILFTSGTTGRAKGAICSHHFLYLFGSTQAETQERVVDDVLTTPLPLCHAAALHHVLGTSLHAGCVGQLKSRFSASAFWDEAAADGATFSIILGTMSAILLKTVEAVPEHSMRSMFCVPRPDDAEEFERRFRVTLLWQGYGMTEISPHPMHARMQPGVPRDTIGRPVSWMDFGVVDDHDRLLPPGEVGELVYRPLLPYSMASGYFEDPEATVAAFRNFMFHTGDLGYYDEEGLVHFVGRRSERIRRGGENISATDLESVVVRHPAVFEAAAYAVPSEFGEDDVKIDVVLRTDLDLNDLHAWLTEQLPRYMVPRYLEQRQSFPKSASAKIEKYKLAHEPLDRIEVIRFERSRR